MPLPLTVATTVSRMCVYRHHGRIENSGMKHHFAKFECRSSLASVQTATRFDFWIICICHFFQNSSIPLLLGRPKSCSLLEFESQSTIAILLLDKDANNFNLREFRHWNYTPLCAGCVQWKPAAVSALHTLAYTLSDMELGHWVTGSMGHLGHLSRPGHRVIILTRCETRVFPVFEKKPKIKIFR